MKPLNLNDTMNSYTFLTDAEQHLEYIKPIPAGFRESTEEAQAKLDRARAFWHTDSMELAAAIKEAQGKARTRTITPEDIMEDLNTVEAHLRISRTAMQGVTVTINHHAQHFPSAYRNKGVPESTYFTAEHNGKGWKLTSIYRDTCRATKAQITLTEGAKAAIIRNAESF